MPNWCSNTITIKGDVETLSQLKHVIEAGEGLLNAIKPKPEALRDTTSPPYPKDSPHYKPPVMVDGHTNWYDWCVDNWGTKWDVECHLEFHDHGDGTAEIEGWFDSAWAPPIAAMQTLADDWDSCYIELMYFEGGMAFVGCWDSEGGDDYYEYGDATSETIRDVIPEYLDDHFDISGLMAMYEEDNE